MKMKLSFRWFGKDDPVSLEYISQIPGVRSVVSAVYDVRPGELWSEASLAKIKAECEKHGLIFDVVESIPVHEDIKLGSENAEEILLFHGRSKLYGRNACKLFCPEPRKNGFIHVFRATECSFWKYL